MKARGYCAAEWVSKMLKFIIFLIIAPLLSACSTPPVYESFDKPGFPKANVVGDGLDCERQSDRIMPFVLQDTRALFLADYEKSLWRAKRDNNIADCMLKKGYQYNTRRQRM